MTEPNQVRPIMKILNQVRELIIDAHNAGEQKGRVKGKKEVVEFIGKYIGFDKWGLDAYIFGESDFAEKWQAQLKEWGIE